MGLKLLGVLCAGVFVGAAVMEIKQLSWRRHKPVRKRARDVAETDVTDGGDEDGDGAERN